MCAGSVVEQIPPRLSKGTNLPWDCEPEEYRSDSTLVHKLTPVSTGSELSKVTVCKDSCVRRISVESRRCLRHADLLRTVNVRQTTRRSSTTRRPDYPLLAPTTASKSTAAKADPTMASDLTTTSVKAVSVGEVISEFQSFEELRPKPFWTRCTERGNCKN